MKSPAHLRTALAVLLTLAFSACGARQQAAPLTADVLYDRGVAAFEAGRYERAIEDLQGFTEAHFGDDRIPYARLLMGRAHMARRDFVMAAGEFDRLVTFYPRHLYVQEARGLLCEVFHRLSPRPQLDQEHTIAGIQHCEYVIAAYPGTPAAEQARARIAEMRHTLADKTYLNGVFYLRRRAFDAAAIYFQEVVDNFPETALAPSALLRLYETYTRVGYVEDATEARERLLREYPESEEARELRSA
jgi:outer membrane protein assembly factor BamD